MSTASNIGLIEREDLISGKKQALEPVKLPQSIFTKAMLDEMLELKNKEDDEKTLTAPEKAAPTEGGDIISTTIIYRAPSVLPLNLLGISGLKIDLKARTDQFKEEYMKSYAMSKSHNLLVSRFAALKYGFFGMMLSFLGVSAEEIQGLQRTAREALIAQDLVLLEENEYAGEMLEIMGGPKKQLKAERTVIDEMRKQLVSQLINCGLKDQCTPERLLEIQTKQCSNILQKLSEEKSSLEYELLMADTGLCQYGDGKDVPQKLDKLQKYITKTKSRLESHAKKAEVLERKSKKSDVFNTDDKVRLTKRGRNI